MADVEGVPFAERAEAPSPYYTDKHVRWQRKVRAFMDAKVAPFVDEWDEAGEYPRALHSELYEAGIGGAVWPVEYGGTPPEGGLDAFMDLILIDELARCGAGGLIASLNSCSISLPVVLAHGSERMKREVAPGVIRGETMMALAVSEPTAGSDVAGLRCTALRSADGRHYVVSGEKKWITNGCKAEYFVVACRTSEAKGARGLSCLLIPRKAAGVSTRRMKTQGWWSSNTAFITFDDVRVLVEDALIGEEGRGFLYIMHNFNHERFSLAAMAARYSRLCLGHAIAWARARRTFGVAHISHPAIRAKCAEMARRIEATQALLEQCAFWMDSGVDAVLLGRQLALCKVQASRCFELCAREASQIMGGSSYLREGKGQTVERLYREVRVIAIGGGSEEVMDELAMKLAGV